MKAKKRTWNVFFRGAISGLSIVLFFLAVVSIGRVGPVWAAVTCQYPSQSVGTDCTNITWPGDSNWKAIGSSTDEPAGDTSAGNQYDFAGSTACPGLYYYVGSPDGVNKYMYYRMRVNYPDTVASTTYSGAIYLLLRKTVPTSGNAYPEYAFTWDSKGAGGNAKHGLEMQNTLVLATTWDTMQMNDWDGDPNNKGTIDIDGASLPPTAANKEGFVRTVDNQPACGAFGKTTFIDFAVKCSYFSRSGVGLGSVNFCNSTLYVQAASKSAAMDHSALVSSATADVARGVAALSNGSPTITSANWSSGQTLIDLISFTATPAPSKVALSWETGSEIDNAGFHVLRSGTVNGVSTRITPSLIPSEGGVVQGAQYSYTDMNVEQGKTYFYTLEDINNNGMSTLHGPISATVPPP